MKRILLSFVLLFALKPAMFAQFSLNTMFITSDTRPGGAPPAGTTAVEYNVQLATGYIFAHDYSTWSYLPLSTAGSRLLVHGAQDDGISSLQVNGVASFMNGMQALSFLTGSNTSGYRMDLGVNDDGINFSNNSTVRGFNFTNENGRILTMAPNKWVGIGTTNPQSLLSVAGTVTAQKVKVTATGWSDFVFADHYHLPSLYELEKFVKQHKHLPDIPAEATVLENGIDVAEMDKKLLQKIEELTLYVIALQKQLDAQRSEIRALKETSVH